MKEEVLHPTSEIGFSGVRPGRGNGAGARRPQPALSELRLGKPAFDRSERPPPLRRAEALAVELDGRPRYVQEQRSHVGIIAHFEGIASTLLLDNTMAPEWVLKNWRQRAR